MEPTTTGNPDLPLLIALAAVIAGPAVAYVVGLMQERGAARRFNAEASWRIALEFRKEVASFVNIRNEQANATLTLQELGVRIAKADYNKFNAEMDKIFDLTRRANEVAQGITLMIGMDSADNLLLTRKMNDVMSLLAVKIKDDFPTQDTFEIPIDIDAFSADMVATKTVAARILKRFQEPV